MFKCNNKLLFEIVLGLLLILAPVTFSNARVLVVAPHPDDDLITSAGVISKAKERGEPVKIVYMTNGDLSGSQMGYTRQAEAVAGQNILGTIEDNLIFLGYPDGYLNQIYTNYLTPSDQYITPNSISATYGNRGLGRTDYHSYRFSTPATYNKPNMLIDLETIISDFLPEHVFVTSEFDAHSDHSTTYRLVSLAVSNVHNINPSYTPVIHKTIIWWQTDGWPNPADPTSYTAEIPDLTLSSSLLWADRESIDVPLSMQSTNNTINLKARSISAHASQDGLNGFIGRFIHKDEFFWVENINGVNQPPIVNAGLDQTLLSVEANFRICSAIVKPHKCIAFFYSTFWLH
jgi:LmbE family N-acetylglucosaminyl deacetylase